MSKFEMGPSPEDLTSAEGLKLPNEGNLDPKTEAIKNRYVELKNKQTSGDKLTPEELTELEGMRGVTSAEGLKLPESIGSELDLKGRTTTEGIEMPKSNE